MKKILLSLLGIAMCLGASAIDDKELTLSVCADHGFSALCTDEVDANGVHTYTSAGSFNVAFKMLDVDVTGYNQVVFDFAEETPSGWSYSCVSGQGCDDVPTGVKQLVYNIPSGTTTLPQVTLFTLWSAANGPIKVKSVKLHYEGSSDDGKTDAKWTCPAYETDITTLPWNKLTQDCIIDFGENKGNIFGTDAGGSDISYVDITGYQTIKVYGATGSVVRAFINREEASAAGQDFIFVFDAIGEDGVATFDLSNVPNTEHIYLSGIKAGPNYNSTATVYGITLVKPSYTVSTTEGAIGTIALDYAATIKGATLYKAVSFDAAEGLGVEEVEGDMEAGTPYIYVATANKVACAQTSASVAHADFDCTASSVGNGLVGCYSEVSPSTWWFGFIGSSYVISNGKLRQISKGSVTIPANHCFFDPAKMTSNASSAKMVIATEEDATSIKNVNSSLEGSKIYDMNGREVKSMKKGGIYIVGGMKICVK